jgi:hypothetical protein
MALPYWSFRDGSLCREKPLLGSPRETRLRRLEKMHDGSFFDASYQGTTSVVPKNAENESGL